MVRSAIFNPTFLGLERNTTEWFKIERERGKRGRKKWKWGRGKRISKSEKMERIIQSDVFPELHRTLPCLRIIITLPNVAMSHSLLDRLLETAPILLTISHFLPTNSNRLVRYVNQWEEGKKHLAIKFISRTNGNWNSKKWGGGRKWSSCTRREGDEMQKEKK